MERLEIKALSIEEFVEPLAEENYLSSEVYQQFKEFTWSVCFFKELNDKRV